MIFERSVLFCILRMRFNTNRSYSNKTFLYFSRSHKYFQKLLEVFAVIFLIYSLKYNLYVLILSDSINRKMRSSFLNIFEYWPEIIFKVLCEGLDYIYRRSWPFSRARWILLIAKPGKCTVNLKSFLICQLSVAMLGTGQNVFQR